METSEQRPASHAVLTLEILEHQAEAISAWLRETFSIEAVELYFPPTSRRWIEAYFPSETEATLAAHVLPERLEVSGGQSKNR